MAANQTSNHKSKSGNGKGHGSTAARPPEPAQEESSSMYDSMSDMAEQASDYISRGASQTQECIRDHSGASVALSLVAGFGIGILVGRALSKPQQQPMSRRYRAAAEGVGRRLMDRIESMIPETLAEHFGK